MSDSHEEQLDKPKKKRAPRRASGIFKRGCRKGLMERVDSNGKERWIDKVIGNLRSIASTERSALGMQAVKILIEQTEDEVQGHERVESEHRLRRAALEEKSDEEIETEIDQLDTEIKELQQALGSVPTGNP
jgi:hypothetical protein